MPFSQGTSLVVQWLGLCASTAGGIGPIPGWGTKPLQILRRGQNKIKKGFFLLGNDIALLDKIKNMHIYNLSLQLFSFLHIIFQSLCIS